MSAPRVAVYMICKNESKFIKRAVESAIDADEVIVCDTGSTDNTLEVLNELSTKYKKFNHLKIHNIHISPWRFDDARNTALGFVNSDIDYCISLDADEYLDDGFIKRFKQNVKSFGTIGKPIKINHCFKTHWNWESPNKPNVTSHYHERIHSRFGFKWIHPVHEKLVGENSIDLWDTSLTIIQKPDVTKNRTSYFELLQQTVIEDPSDWKIKTFLANEYIERLNYEEAKVCINDALKIPESDKVFLLVKLGDIARFQYDISKAIQCYEQVISLAPHMREVYIISYFFYQSIGDNDKANEMLEKANACTIETNGYMRMEDAWNGSIIN